MKKALLLGFISLVCSSAFGQWTSNGSNISTSQNVGIGTSSPAYKLDVNGDIRANGNLDISLGNNGNIRIGKRSDGGNINTPVGGVSAQYNIDFTGYRDIVTDQIGARIAAIRFNNCQTGTAYIQNTGLAFFTNPSGLNSGTTDLLERMRITPAGNIGIGTSSPEYKLDVNGDIRANGNLDISLANNGNIRIGKRSDGGNINTPVGSVSAQYNIDFTGYRDIVTDQIGARIAAIRFNNCQTGTAYIQNTGLAFFTNPSGLNSGTTDLLERMRITPAGNIGIGTETPTHKLDVSGDIKADAMYVNGTVYANEVKIEATKWSDFVFDKDYKLASLEEVKAHIEEHKHLPDIPSEKQVMKEGINIAEMQAKLLQKIEELTLYTIRQEKRSDEQEKRIKELEEQFLNK